MTVYELNREELAELKLNHWSIEHGFMPPCEPIDKLVSDEYIFEQYSDTDFVRDDFWCNANRKTSYEELRLMEIAKWTDIELKEKSSGALASVLYDTLMNNKQYPQFKLDNVGYAECDRCKSKIWIEYMGHDYEISVIGV